MFLSLNGKILLYFFNCVVLFFKNYFNWLKFTTVTPSVHFKNRLFIEKSSRSNNIYTFLGETHKSFSWLQNSSTNLSLFWLRTSQRRLVLFIAVFLIIFFLLVINTNSLGVVLQSSIFKAFFYFFWRTFDWLYFFLIQLQYLVITITISFIFTLFNWILSSNLSLASWMQKHHAEVAPAYMKKKANLVYIKDKSDFGLLVSNSRNLNYNKTKNNGFKNTKLFCYNHTNLNSYNNLSLFFKKYFNVLLTTIDFKPRVTQQRASLFLTLTNKKTINLEKNNQFNLDSLLSKNIDNSFFVTPEDRQPWNKTNCSSVYVGSSFIFKNLYEYIRTTRWVSLNTTNSRSETINNEIILPTLNITKIGLQKNNITELPSLFNSIEWLEYRNVIILNLQVLKKLYKNNNPVFSRFVLQKTEYNRLPYNYLNSFNRFGLLSSKGTQKGTQKNYNSLVELSQKLPIYNVNSLTRIIYFFNFTSKVSFKNQTLTFKKTLCKNKSKVRLF